MATKATKPITREEAIAMHYSPLTEPYLLKSGVECWMLTRAEQALDRGGIAHVRVWGWSREGRSEAVEVWRTTRGARL